MSLKTAGTKIEQRDYENPLVKPALANRLEHLNLENRTQEAERRINALHNSLSHLSHSLNIPSQDLELGKAALKKIINLKVIPKEDSIAKKIVASVKNFGTNVMGFFTPKQFSGPFEEYTNLVDKAIDEPLDGDKSYDSFDEYVTNEIKDDRNKPIHPISNEDFQLVVERATREALANSKVLDLDSTKGLKLMKQLSVYVSDHLFNDEDFSVSSKSAANKAQFKEATKQLNSLLKESAIDGGEFVSRLSQEESYYDTMMGYLVKATLIYSKENPGGDFVKAVKDNSLSLKHFVDVVRNAMPMAAVPMAAVQQVEASLHNTENRDLISEVENFNYEFFGAGRKKNYQRDLRAYLGEQYRKHLVSKPKELVHEITSRLVGENINGDLNIKNDSRQGDIESVGFNFQDYFAKMAKLAFSTLTYEPMSSSQADKLTKWAFSEPSSALDGSQERFKNMIKDISNLPADAVNIQNFRDNKQKLIFLALMESLSFDNAGKITKTDDEYLNSFIDGISKLYKAGFKPVG